MGAKRKKQKELYRRVKSKDCDVKHRDTRQEENAQVDVEIKR